MVLMIMCVLGSLLASHLLPILEQPHPWSFLTEEGRRH